MGICYTSYPPQFGFSHCGIESGCCKSMHEAKEKWNEQVYLYQQKQNKLTGEQIVKALEICNSLDVRCGNGCPYYEVPHKNGKRCTEMMIDDTLDLIKRQKAEIEELRADYNYLFETMPHLKSEATKEFAEKLKEYYPSIADWIDYTAGEVLKD